MFNYKKYCDKQVDDYIKCVYSKPKTECKDKYNEMSGCLASYDFMRTSHNRHKIVFKK